MAQTDVPETLSHDGWALRFLAFHFRNIRLPLVLAFPVSETDVAETDVPETDDPETDVPETDDPETEVPETDDPETDDPETEVHRDGWRRRLAPRR